MSEIAMQTLNQSSGLRPSQPKLSRRQFLRIVAVAGTMGVAAKLGIDQFVVKNSSAQRATATRVLMGTIVNLTVIGDDLTVAQTAINRTLQHMAQLETVLSRHQPTSQISSLNQAGHFDNPSPHLVEVLQLAIEVSGRTGGAFDVTVKPLLDLYTAHQQTAQIPTDGNVQAILPLVGYHNLHAAPDRITFAQTSMGITLDGIAKGYIIDEGVAQLQAHGFANVLVEAGGDLFAAGQKTVSTPWSIGIQSPRAETHQLVTQVTVSGQAVASSGDYMQTFTPDFAHHHILDPRTGFSAPELASVTTIAPSAALADALATALMVLGSAGLPLIEQWPQCAAYVIDKQLFANHTRNFPV